MNDIAKKIMRRLDALALISEEPECLTRTFASPAMRQAIDLVAFWMREAGMSVREDAIGNLIGHYEAEQPKAKILLLGSHLDTVRDAGKFDGPLGVILAIACVERLHKMNARLPFALDVVAFVDEEGVRFQTTYLGSRALTGTLNEEDLRRTDASGITMAAAINAYGCDVTQLKQSRLNPQNLIGFVEAHIEQGTVLEEKDLSVGIVTGIAGQTRLRFTFSGVAGHAGTTPMPARKDALCAAAEFILAVEAHARDIPGLVATVGQIRTEPNASNVIPGQVILTVDVRHQTDSIRKAAREQFRKTAAEIQKRRGVKSVVEIIQETATVPCAPDLSGLLKQAAQGRFPETVELPSGAGHDTAVMARVTRAAMLFIRNKGGLSHHPDESVKPDDISAAYEVMNDFVDLLATSHRSHALR